MEYYPAIKKSEMIKFTGFGQKGKQHPEGGNAD